MNRLVKFLISLPKSLAVFIWRFFWGMVRALVIMVILGLALFWFAQHSDTPFAQGLRQSFAQSSEILSTAENSGWRQTLEEIESQGLTTDYHEPTSSQGSRWSTNTATVYIASTDQTLIDAYTQALANWNETGAFTFTWANSQEEADIVLTDKSDSSTQAAGEAQTTTDARSNIIKHVDVYLNTYYLLNPEYGYSQDRIINTAEHELGHAIGLDHNDSEVSAMQSAGSYYSIQPVDIAAVEALYAS